MDVETDWSLTSPFPRPPSFVCILSSPHATFESWHTLGYPLEENMKGLVEFTKYTDSGPVVSLDADVLEARARVTPMTPSPSPFATLTANGGETAQFGLASRGTTSSATSFPREERALDVNTRLPEDVSLNYNYFGMDQPGLAKEAAESCEARMMGIRDTANLQTAIETFLSFAKERYFQPQHTALALTVRVETQQKTFNTPNPHHDGVFMLRGFSGIRGKYWTTNQGDPPILKLGTVLLGPGTGGCWGRFGQPEYLGYSGLGEVNEAC